MLPYVFSAMTMKSVGKAAQEMVEEVRTVFRILIQLYVSIKMKENESKSK